MTPVPNFAVLLIAHALPPAEHSGVPAAAYEYARHLVSRGVRVGVLYAGADEGTTQPLLQRRFEEPHGFTRYEVRPTQYQWRAWSIYDASLASPERARVLDSVLDDFRPSLVHVLDLVNLPSEWPEAIAGRRIPILRQMCNAEDLCGCIQPAFPAPPEVVCPSPITPGQCAECCFRGLVMVPFKEGSYSAHQVLQELSALRSGSVAEFERHLSAKRELARRTFARCYDRIVFQSQTFRTFFERTLPLPSDRTVVIPQGIDAQVNLPREAKAVGPVSFLHIGSLNITKGGSDIAAVFSHSSLLGRDDYELNLYGTGEEKVLGDLLARNLRVHYRGGFATEELPSILNAADVGLSPSRFETFHRVTREYLIAGRPVIGSTAFGIPDVVRTGENGVIFEAGDVEGFRRAVLSVLDDRDYLARLTAGARATRIRTKEEEIDDLLAQYNAIVSAATGA